MGGWPATTNSPLKKTLIGQLCATASQKQCFSSRNGGGTASAKQWHTLFQRAAGRAGRLEPELQLLNRAGKLRGLHTHLTLGEHPVGAELGLTGLRFRRGLQQPEVYRLGVQLPDGAELHTGSPGQRDQLVSLVRTHPQEFVPSGLKFLVRPVGHLSAQPARPFCRNPPQAPRAGRLIFESAGVDFVGTLSQHDFPAAVQDDPVGQQVVLEQFSAGVGLLAGRGDHDRIAAGFNPCGLQVQRTGTFFSRAFFGVILGVGSRLAPVGEEYRQQFAVELIAGAGRIDPHHVHLVLESGHFADRIEAERSLAGDFHRQVSRGGRPALRRAARVGGDQFRLAQFQVELLDVGDLEQLDAAEVRTALLAARTFAFVAFVVAGQQLDVHPPPPAVIGSQAKVDRVRSPEVALGELDVPGDDEQIVFGSGFSALAANGDSAGQLAGLQSADLHPRQIDRLVELQLRALGRLQNHGLAFALIPGGAGRLGREDHCEGMQFHPALAKVLIRLHQQLDPAAFEDLGAIELPGTGGEQSLEFSEVQGEPVSCSLALGLGDPPGAARIGRRLDQRHRHQRVRTIRHQHNRKAAGDADGAGHEIVDSG